MSDKRIYQSDINEPVNAVKYVYRTYDESDASVTKRYLHHIINLHPLYMNMASDMSELNRNDIKRIIRTYDTVVQNLLANLDWKP